ncbi:HlyD family secretion protein [Metapseudomonas resinovorans]|uniref:Putative membrane fusion protein n=1 Tax=Metapseudomonas resinovorans NBRC 106553 TaxID=1245471 RepID=S6AYM1_METRE|nr:HlyD family secretion protein [Pseudomonas resinovorans]BAN49891.1 putative membrane fusion protein [Pseudomonas resinovorans NBRC 106553]
MNHARILKPVIPAALLVGVGLLAWGAWHLLDDSADQYTNDAYVHADFTLAAPKVPGFIHEVLVEDNQVVKAGQVLARIDDRDYRAALEGARAKVASARAQLDNATATLERQASLIEQAQATLEADRAEIVFAQHELARHEKLVHRGAGTLQNAQLARSRFDTVRARQAEHSAALLATRKQTDILGAERDAAQAALDNAQAGLRQAELDLSHTELHAPIDGMVGRRAVRVGAFVKPGDALLAVVPLDRAYVVANFQETQLTHVRPGQAVRVTVDTFPGESLRGHVQSIAPATGVAFAAIAPANATGNFTKVVQRIPVKVVLDPGQSLLGQLRVGMSVEASIDTGSADATIARTN